MEEFLSRFSSNSFVPAFRSVSPSEEPLVMSLPELPEARLRSVAWEGRISRHGLMYGFRLYLGFLVFLKRFFHVLFMFFFCIPVVSTCFRTFQHFDTSFQITLPEGVHSSDISQLHLKMRLTICDGYSVSSKDPDTIKCHVDRQSFSA